VVALVVVLGQDLPVRRYLVVVAGGDDELLAAVVSDHILQIACVCLEWGRVAAGVGEEPALPLHDALVAVLFETARATGADPTPVEEVLLLPPEHGLGGVRFGGRVLLLPKVSSDGASSSRTIGVMCSSLRAGLEARADGSCC
jgi:hypothetical protein